MPVTNYTTVNGRVVSQNKAGVYSQLLRDPLGNVIATANSAGTKTNDTTYWPYGEVRTGSVSATTPFGFCGTWGYYTDTSGRQYVRARYYRPTLGRWQTVDPLWPGEEAFGYARERPSSVIDHLGKWPWDAKPLPDPFTTDCPEPLNRQLENAYSMMANKFLKLCEGKDKSGNKLIENYKRCLIAGGYTVNQADALSKCLCKIGRRDMQIKVTCRNQAYCNIKGMHRGMGGFRNTNPCEVSVADPSATPLDFPDISLLDEALSHEILHCCGTSHTVKGAPSSDTANMCLKSTLGWGWWP